MLVFLNNKAEINLEPQNKIKELGFICVTQRVKRCFYKHNSFIYYLLLSVL